MSLMTFKAEPLGRKQMLLGAIGVTLLFGIAGGGFAYATIGETGAKIEALNRKKAEVAQLAESLEAAKKLAGNDTLRGMRSVGLLQNKVNTLAAQHLVKVTNFQSATSLSVSKSKSGKGLPPGWGTITVEFSLKGTSRSTFNFLKEVPEQSLPISIQELDISPSTISPNGGSEVSTRLKIDLYSQQGGGNS